MLNIKYIAHPGGVRDCRSAYNWLSLEEKNRYNTESYEILYLIFDNLKVDESKTFRNRWKEYLDKIMSSSDALHYDPIMDGEIRRCAQSSRFAGVFGGN